MTDYSVADELAAAIAEVRPEIAGAVHADTYSLNRVTRVSDGRGGTTVTETVVETGRCRLVISTAMGREGLSGDTVQSTYRLTADLPTTTAAKPDDVLAVNGRRYQIVSIQHQGLIGLFPVADLEAVA